MAPNWCSLIKICLIIHVLQIVFKLMQLSKTAHLLYYIKTYLFCLNIATILSPVIFEQIHLFIESQRPKHIVTYVKIYNFYNVEINLYKKFYTLDNVQEKGVVLFCQKDIGGSLSVISLCNFPELFSPRYCINYFLLLKWKL